ncbi:MAG: aminopeptidase P family protein [Chloroflexi bacterium]|nr:aminopeptidase P family protein [Chloroflexota bacterium]
MVRTGHQRDLLGQEIVDFDERVDMERLKRERLARLQTQMAKANLGGMLFFDPINIRYATGRRFPGVFGMRFFSQYAIVPQEGTPLVFGNNNEDGSYAMEKGTFWDFFPCGRNVEEASRLWGDRLVDSMKELGIAGERLGIDRMDFYCSESLKAHEIEIADGRIPIERARSIKTEDEVSLIRQACAIADIAICAVKDAIEPGVTENELFAIMTQTNLKHGGEHMDARLLTAGGNTNPWTGNSTDRIVRPGDLVAMDTDMAGPMGYFADFSRTYLCGDGKPNKEQLEAYKIGYNFIYESLHLFKPGMSFPEIAEKCPPLPEEYKLQRYPMIAHGDGMSDEWPTIYWPDQSWSGFGNDPDVLEENMVLSLEGLASKVGARESVKLEEEILITANGPEILSHAPFDERFF